MDPSINSLMHIVPLLERIECASNSDNLLVLLDKFIRTLGFTHYAIGPLQNPNICEKIGYTNFPPEVMEQWQDQDYIQHDPVVNFALNTDDIFTWQEAREHASRFGKKIYAGFESIDMGQGVGVPIKVKGMPRGLFSLAHEDPKLSIRERTDLKLICVQVYIRLLYLHQIISSPSSVDLTKREIDVLHYVAAGKSNWEIGKILTISEDGVKKHMQNICRKLGAANRVHAVTLALRSGKILA